MRDTPLDPHIGSEAVIRPEFVDELADRLRSELRGVTSVDVRPSTPSGRSRGWVWFAVAAAAIGVIAAATWASRSDRVGPAPVATVPSSSTVPVPTASTAESSSTSTSSSTSVSTSTPTSPSAAEVDNTAASVPLAGGPVLEPDLLAAIPFGSGGGEITAQDGEFPSPVAVTSDLVVVLEAVPFDGLSGRALLFDRTGSWLRDVAVEGLPASVSFFASTPTGTLVIVGSNGASGGDTVVRVFDASTASTLGTIPQIAGAFVPDGASGPYRLEPDGVYSGEDRILSQQLVVGAAAVSTDEQVDGATATLTMTRFGTRTWSIDAELDPARSGATPVVQGAGPLGDGAWMTASTSEDPAVEGSFVAVFEPAGTLSWYRPGAWSVAASDIDQLLFTRTTSDGLEIGTIGTIPPMGFVPACTEIAPSIETSPIADGESFATFGPLGSAPLLTLTLPAGRSELSPEPLPASAAIVRIPGGFLVAIRSNSSGYFPGSILLAVDDDGTIRWRRCTDTISTIAVAGPGGGPDVVADAALVTWQHDGSSPTESAVYSLVDGTVTTELDELLQRESLGPLPTGSARRVDDLLIIPRTRSDGEPNDLVTLDLVTMTPGTLPAPPVDGDLATVGFDAADDGSILATAFDSTTGWELPVAVLTDGRWSTDRAVLGAARQVTGGYSFNPSTSLEGRDGAGTVVWRRDDIRAPGGEGFRSATVGDVVIAVSAGPDNDAPALGGYARSDGRTLWELDGYHQVTAIGDGLAMVSTLDDAGATIGWELIDVTTGERFEPGQSWDGADTFAEECCGGTEFTRVDRLGGFLAAFHPGRIDVWYPSAVRGTIRIVDTAG